MSFLGFKSDDTYLVEFYENCVKYKDSPIKIFYNNKKGYFAKRLEDGIWNNFNFIVYQHTHVVNDRYEDNVFSIDYIDNKGVLENYIGLIEILSNKKTISRYNRTLYPIIKIRPTSLISPAQCDQINYFEPYIGGSLYDSLCEWSNGQYSAEEYLSQYKVEKETEIEIKTIK